MVNSREKEKANGAQKVENKNLFSFGQKMTHRRRLLNTELLQKIMVLISLILIQTAFLGAGSARASTINATSCSQADVQAAINQALDGDTVLVPVGSCTWNSSLTLTSGITLIGAGIGNTIITGNITNQNAGIVTYAPATPSLNKSFRLTGFTLDAASKSNGVYLLSNTTDILNKVRIDHLRIINPGGTNAGRCILVRGAFFGVIDNNLIEQPAGKNGISVYGDVAGASGGAEWAGLSRNYGDANNLFIEDNTFLSSDTSIDGGHGGRYVARYNTFIAGANLLPGLDMHGNQPVGGFSMMVNEVYGNSWDLASHNTRLWDQRGGQSLIFYNSVVNAGSINAKIREEYTDALYPSANAFLQHVTNSYFWVNKSGGLNINTTIGQDTSDSLTPNVPVVLQENREFWQQGVSFDGISGVGAGPLSSRPPTCTTGVGYWATNQSTTDLTGMIGTNPATPISGTLYKCTSTDTWEAYYTPYTYPYPLRSVSENIYIAQTSRGLDTGADVSNAHSLVWLNNVNNWGAEASKVSAGDTVRLVGLFTSPLIIGGSGSSGSPITILFEDGAKFSRPYWGTGPNAAIYASGKDYITIDGGTNGIIENTDNGTVLGNQKYSSGIHLNSSDNWEIKNLTIQNIYVRTPNSSTDFIAGVVGIYSIGANVLSIHDCIITEAVELLGLYFRSGSTNYNVYKNTLSKASAGINVGSGGPNATLTTLNIYGNTINLGDSFSYPSGDHYHGDGIHFWAVHSGSEISDAKIYGNRIGPTTLMKATASATTGWVFIEGKTTNALVYNNLFLANSENYPSNGFMFFKDAGWGATGGKAYNNTIVSDGGGTCFGADDTFVSAEFKNNVCLTNGYAMSLGGDLTSPDQIDYNDYYGSAGWNIYGIGMHDWSQWKTKGYDLNSKNAIPSLNENYEPKADDTVAKDAGIFLLDYFSTDFRGRNRPHSGPWDIGAYEYTETTPPDTTPPVLSLGAPSGNLPAGTTQTTLSLTTDENATCKYGTVPNTIYASIPNTFTTTNSTNHSQTITNLTNGTTYNYYLRCKDTLNNQNTADYRITFSVNTPQIKSSDLNQDTKVDSLDFEILKLDWDKTDKPKSDINQDGIVNTQDLGIMMSEWESSSK